MVAPIFKETMEEHKGSLPAADIRMHPKRRTDGYSSEWNMPMPPGTSGEGCWAGAEWPTNRQCAWNGSTRAGNSAQAAYLSVGVPGENLKVTVKDSRVSSLQPLLLEFAVQVYHHQI